MFTSIASGLQVGLSREPKPRELGGGGVIRMAALAIIFLMASPAQALDQQKLISQFTHTAWTAQDGLPGPVRAIVQTADGYLWLGTEGGLYRFDGLRLSAWQPSFGELMPASSVWSLCTGRDGSLWIGFSSGGIGQLRDGHLKNYSHTDGIPAGGILSIVEDGKGSIWAGGQYGLSKLEGGKWHKIGTEQGYPAPGVQTMLVDGDGKLWVATDNYSFRLSKNPVLANTILTLAPNAKRFTATGLAVGMVRMMSAIPQSGVWIAHTSGDAVFVPNQAELKPGILIRLSDPPMCLLIDGDDSLWIGLLKGGLLRPRDHRNRSNPGLDQFQTVDGLSNNTVYSAFKDREGNLWFGTGGGLDRFHENKVTPYSAREGVVPDDQIALTATGDGSVWFAGYHDNIVERLRGGTLVSSKLPAYHGSESGQILSLYADKNGHVWVGGLFKLAVEVDGRFSYPKVSDIDDVHEVHAIAQDAEGNVWVTVWDDNGGGVLRLRDGTWTNFRSKSHLPKYRCRVLYGDPQGRLWMGFEDGEVAVYEKDEFHVYSLKDGLPEGRVFAIKSDREGHIWIGGAGGLSRFDRGHFITLTRESGLPGNSVSGIVEDDDGFLWLAGALGVLRASPQELEKALLSSSYRVQGLLFDATDGFRGLPRQREPFPTAARAADGRLWFSTTAGVAMIDPKHLPKNILPPPLTIEALRADDRTVSISSGLRLPPRTKNLQFEFAALSLTAPERVRFRYKLEGYDDDWRGPVSERQARYTNLPPRSYRFRVIACNNDGVWNENGAALEFTILPAFYQTRWFLLLWVGAAASAVWLAYQWRIRQMAARLDLQFNERLAERTRIAQDLHDTLLQGFLSASMQLQVADDQLSADSPAKPLVARIICLMRQVIEEGRSAVRGLRISSCDSDNLEQAFSRVPQELTLPEQIGFRVIVEGQPRMLHPVIRDEAYRIGREALVNAFHHSGASGIELQIEYATDGLRVVVRDNGTGISPDLQRGGREGHWGLTVMRERAQRIGAKLKIWSGAAGTEIELSIPGYIAFAKEPPGNSRGRLNGFDTPNTAVKN